MRRFLFVLAVIGLVPAMATARWAFQGAPVPLERLLTNVKAHLEAHRDDPHAYYVLGRLHSLAWSTGKAEATVAEREADGESDPGEVVPASEFGIMRIAVAPQGRRDGVPWHGAGIRMQDGRTLPVWDWVAESRR